MIPPNSSNLEKAIIEATEFKVQIKPMLLYEVKEAPASILKADIKIEEEPPYKFQIGMKDIPNDIDKLITLAKLSTPARSRLMRIYNHSYDIRYLILDQSEFGSLLSDNSGVKRNETVLSFGRSNPFEAIVPNPNLKCSTIRIHHNNTLSNDIFRLDTSYFGEKHTNNYNSINIRNHILHNTNHIQTQKNLGKPIHLAKALITLSDSWKLNDINACFPVNHKYETGTTLTLNKDMLSENLWSIGYKEILERFISNYIYNTSAKTNVKIKHYITRKHCFCKKVLPSLKQIQCRKHFKTTYYQGSLIWHQHRHLNRPWNDREVIISSEKAGKTNAKQIKN